MRNTDVPAPSPIFVGRCAELERLSRGLARISVAHVFGVAGVGKSGLAFAFADAWAGPTRYAKIASGGLDAAIEDACRSLELRAATLPALLDRLDEDGALWIIDDIHVLDDPTQLLEACAARLRTGRVIALSRQRVPRDASHSDRLEISLQGLDRPAGRALWSHLDDLYGPAVGFEAAWSRFRGSPFHLRRAHAGGLEADESLAETVVGLSPDQIRLAAALALSETPLPVALVNGLLPANRGRRALRRLVTLLIAEVRGSESCTMHDLFREAVLDSVSPALRDDLTNQLASAIRSSELDVVTRAREVIRHLGALGRWREAGELMVEYSPLLVAAGATAEALRLLETIPPTQRSDAVCVARAKCKAHGLDIAGAYAELHSLISASDTASVGARLMFAELACVLADLDSARSAALAVVADESLAAEARLPARVIAAFALACRGSAKRAVEELEVAERAETDWPIRAKLAFARARTAWLGELDAEAERAARSAREVLPDSTLPYDHGIQAPVAFASIEARAGRFDGVDELFADMAGLSDLDESSQLFVARARAGIAYERGDRCEALRLLVEVDAGYSRCGHVLGQALVQPWIARVLMVLGRRQQALELMSTARELAQRCGVGAAVAAIEAAAICDPLVQIHASTPLDVCHARRGHWVRSTVIRAVQAAAHGRKEATSLAESAATRAGGDGYGLDRALVALTRATLARLSEDEAAVASAMKDANQHALADGVDATLMTALFERLGHLRVVTNDSSVVSSETPCGPDDCDVWIDARNHEICAGGHSVALGRRPVLRRLLYRLSRHPNEPIPKEALIEHTWQTEYDPLRHDNAFWVNLRRLRLLIEPMGLFIEVQQGSYRLRVPKRFVYVGDDDGAGHARHVV